MHKSPHTGIYPSIKMHLPSSLDNMDQLQIQKVPLDITCIIELDFDF
jgi:hypothetical protein